MKPNKNLYHAYHVFGVNDMKWAQLFVLYRRTGTRLLVRPVKTQIINPRSLIAWFSIGSQGFNASSSAAMTLVRLLSDCADAQSDLVFAGRTCNLVEMLCSGSHIYHKYSEIEVWESSNVYQPIVSIYYAYSNILRILPIKMKTFRWNILVVFIFLLKTQIVGTCKNHPGKAVLTSIHNLCFWVEIRKLRCTPVNPSFTV